MPGAISHANGLDFPPPWSGICKRAPSRAFDGSNRVWQKCRTRHLDQCQGSGMYLERMYPLPATRGVNRFRQIARDARRSVGSLLIGAVH